MSDGSWAHFLDVTDSWIGDGVPVSDALVESWLGKAQREVMYRVPGIQDRIDADTSGLLLDTARDVVVAMVTRVFRNPDGIRQTNVTTGPMTASKTFGGDTPGALALTSDELAKLQGVKSSGAFTVSMIPASSPFYVG